MPAPANNLASKVCRAFVAHLIAQGAGTAADVLPQNTLSERSSLPLTGVRVVAARPEIPFTGNYRCRVECRVKGSAVTEHGHDNPDLMRVAHDNRFGLTHDAFMLTDDNASLQATADAITAAGRALATAGTAKERALHTDMAEFTCLFLQSEPSFGEEDPSAEGCSWVDVLTVEAVCCGSAID